MIFALFGATGESGKELLKQSVQAGNSIRLLARNPQKITDLDANVLICEFDDSVTSLPSTVDADRPSVYVVKGDATNPKHVEAVISGLGLRCKCLNLLITQEETPKPVDAVASTLGSKSLSGPDTQIHSIGVKNIVQAMQKHSVERLVVESAVGTAESWHTIPFWAKPTSYLGAWILKERQADKDVMEAHLLANKDTINYTIIRPGALYNSNRRHPSPKPETLSSVPASFEDGYGYRWGSSAFGAFVGRNDVAHLMLRCMSSNLASREGVNISYY
jgi:nucleoside-diphosphate-sugar epimerase